MAKTTRFPSEWLLKKSREECEQLQKEVARLSKENSEMKSRLDSFTVEHEAQIAARKEQLYIEANRKFTTVEKKYSKARKALSDIKKIAYGVSESDDAVADIADICDILIKYYIPK